MCVMLKNTGMDSFFGKRMVERESVCGCERERHRERDTQRERERNFKMNSSECDTKQQVFFVFVFFNIMFTLSWKWIVYR